MKEFQDVWAEGARVRDERRIVCGVVAVAVLVVIAEIFGVFGVW